MLASSVRHDLPVGQGRRSCSHAQGIVNSQLQGQEGVFTRGRQALVPRGFCRPLQHWAGPLVRLWFILARLLSAAYIARRRFLVPCGQRKEGVFSPQGRLAMVPGVFLPSSATLSMAPC